MPAEMTIHPKTELKSSIRSLPSGTITLDLNTGDVGIVLFARPHEDKLRSQFRAINDAVNGS